MLDKATICNALGAELVERGKRIQRGFDDLNSAVSDDSKSTAGDKHETGRAMVHLEQEKLSQQLTKLNQLKEAFAKINPKENHNSIQFGSIAYTSNGIFFFSIGLGKLSVEGQDLFCLTLTSPLGQKMKNGKVGDKITMNEEVLIETIL